MTGIKLILVFLFAQIMDIVTTYIALTYFGQTEVNPIANSLFKNIGMRDAMALKLIMSYVLVLAYAFFNMKFNMLTKSIVKSMQLGSLLIWIGVCINITGILSLVIYK